MAKNATTTTKGKSAPTPITNEVIEVTKVGKETKEAKEAKEAKPKAKKEASVKAESTPPSTSSIVSSATSATSATSTKSKAKAVKSTTDVSSVSSVSEMDLLASHEGPDGQDDAAETSDALVMVDHSGDFLLKLQQLSTMISTLKTEYRTIEKRFNRDLKLALKQNSRRKRKAGNRAPSGFVKPTRISDELASFLGKENGTEMARTAVTRDINAYIRSNNLQDKDNGRQINPDEKLASLLKLGETDVLTYFNLQRFMSPHFAKSVKAAAAAAASASASASASAEM